MTTASSGFLEKWLQERIRTAQAAHGGGTDPVGADSVMENMKKNLEDEFGALGSWLTRPESNEVRDLCDKGKEDGGKDWQGQGLEPQYRKVLCQAILEIKYFMNGVEKKKGGGGTSAHDEKAQITELNNDRAYARCIVGMLALSEIYGDHCYLNEVIRRVEEKVSTEMEGKLKEHLKHGHTGNLDICKKVTKRDLIFGKALLQGRIKQWTETKRKSKDGWRIRVPWGSWPTVCKQTAQAGTSEHEAARKDNLQQNKGSLVKFTLGDSTQSSGGAPSSTMEDILVNDSYTIPENKLTEALSSAIQNANNAVTGSTGGPISPDLTKTIMEEFEKLSQDQSG
ncbi:SICAvar, type I (fragment), partial [Plasmodium knowlesi strain H]